MASNIDALERLAKLRETGALSVTEFELEKRKLLTAAPAPRRSGVTRFLFAGTILLGIGVAGVVIWTADKAPKELPKATPAAAPPVSLQTAAAAPATIAATEAAAPVPSANPWVGTYKGKFEGEARGTLKISEGRRGRLKFSLGLGAEECAGGLEANLAVLSETEGVVALPEDDSGNACRISLVRHGGTIDLTEEGCGYHHGFACSFSGTVKR